MAETCADLETSDLGTLLRLLPDEAVNGLAKLLVEMVGSDMESRLHLPRALTRQGLTGMQLIPDILDDLGLLASHKTEKPPTYREILRTVAMRHDIADDGNQQASVVERRIQQKYLDKLRPTAKSFKDDGADEWYRTAAFIVPIFGWAAYLMSPNWRPVTAVVLEVAALRRTALVQQLAESLEL